MVDRISGSEPNLVQEGLLSKRSEKVEELNRDAAQNSAKVSSLKGYDDQAVVSNEAKRLYEAEKFARLAQRIDEPYDYEKVSAMKNMVDNGRINDLLRQYDNAELAEDLLSSPAKAFLR